MEICGTKNCVSYDERYPHNCYSWIPYTAIKKCGFTEATKPPISSGSDEAAGSTCAEMKSINIHRVACAIVSHTIDESAGCREDGKSNSHCIDYAVSKIKELM